MCYSQAAWASRRTTLRTSHRIARHRSLMRSRRERTLLKPATHLLGLLMAPEAVQRLRLQPQHAVESGEGSVATWPVACAAGRPEQTEHSRV